MWYLINNWFLSIKGELPHSHHQFLIPHLHIRDLQFLTNNSVMVAHSCNSRISRTVILRHHQHASGTNRILHNVCFLSRETDLQWKSRGFPMFEMARSSEIYFQSNATEYAFSLKRADAWNVCIYIYMCVRSSLYKTKSSTWIMTRNRAKIGVIMTIALSNEHSTSRKY